MFPRFHRIRAIDVPAGLSTSHLRIRNLSSTLPWGLTPRLALRLFPTSFDALPSVTLSGVLNRPSWQNNPHERAARSYADSLATQRDLIIFNAVMRATMGELPAQETTIKSAETVSTSDDVSSAETLTKLLSSASNSQKSTAFRSSTEAFILSVVAEPSVPMDQAAVAFLERATSLFRDVILAPTGLPVLGPLKPGPVSEPRIDRDEERQKLVDNIMHPKLAALLREASSSGKLAPVSVPAIVSISKAKVVDAFAVWDGTMHSDDVNKGLWVYVYQIAVVIAPYVYRPFVSGLVRADERGHSIALCSLDPERSFLVRFLASYGHLLGLHPLRRAALRVTVAFDCMEHVLLEAVPVDVAIHSEHPAGEATPVNQMQPRRAIHTLTLEVEVTSGRLGSETSQIWNALGQILESRWPDVRERLPVLRYLFSAPLEVSSVGWRVVSIDGAGGGDGCGPGALSFSNLFDIGRDLARQETANNMRDNSSDEEVTAHSPVAEAVFNHLDALLRRVEGLRVSWCCSQEPAAEQSNATLKANALYPRVQIGKQTLNGHSVDDALDVIVRLLGAAAWASSEVAQATSRPPWESRSSLESAWEEIEADLVLRGTSDAPPSVRALASHALLRGVSVRQLRRQSCFSEALALEASDPAPLSRTDLDMICEALSRVDVLATRSSIDNAGKSSEMHGSPSRRAEPWELVCDRRRRLLARKAIVEAHELLGRPLDYGTLAHVVTQDRRVSIQGELQGCLLDAELLFSLAAESVSALLDFVVDDSEPPGNGVLLTVSDDAAFREARQLLAARILRLKKFIDEKHASLMIMSPDARTFVDAWSSNDGSHVPLHADQTSTDAKTPLDSKEHGALLSLFLTELGATIDALDALSRLPLP